MTYEEIADAILPILIKQAQLSKPISYTGLSSEIGKNCPRMFARPLAIVAERLLDLEKDSARWKLGKIPMLSVIVVRKGASLPRTMGDMTKELQKRYPSYASDKDRMGEELKKVCEYHHWDKVLLKLDL